MQLMHHYNNTSVNSPYDHMMPIYDGYDYYIPPFHNLILVPATRLILSIWYHHSALAIC